MFFWRTAAAAGAGDLPPAGNEKVDISGLLREYSAESINNASTDLPVAAADTSATTTLLDALNPVVFVSSLLEHLHLATGSWVLVNVMTLRNQGKLAMIKPQMDVLQQELQRKRRENGTSQWSAPTSAENVEYQLKSRELMKKNGVAMWKNFVTPLLMVGREGVMQQ